MKRVKMAGLDVVLAGGSDRDGGGEGPLVILLHGFGAPGDDLVALHRVMRVPRETRFAFPAAPIETHMMPGFDSRAWWNIDMVEMQTAMARGDLRALSAREPDGMSEARDKLDALLGELERTMSPTSIVLGGFSQGSMLSLDVALRTAHRIDALVLLSSTLLAESTWVPLMKEKLVGKPIFQSHGTSDPILPYALAEKLKDALVAAGANVTFASFRGVHEIPPPVLDALCTFLGPVLSKGA